MYFSSKYGQIISFFNAVASINRIEHFFTFFQNLFFRFTSKGFGTKNDEIHEKHPKSKFERYPPCVKSYPSDKIK